MADIIPLDDKIEVAREKKAAVRRQQKGVIVRRVLQCTGCSLKCEKCGTQIEAGAVGTSERCPHSRFPYKFCEACEDEYQDYIERLQGRGDRIATGTTTSGSTPGVNGSTTRAASTATSNPRNF